MSNVDTAIPTFLKRKEGDAPLPKKNKKLPPKSVPKKAGTLVAKAAAERDALAAKAKAVIADGEVAEANASKKPNAKSAATKSTSKPKVADKPASKSAPTPAKERSGKYDWTKAEQTAKTGTLPPLPPFNSYKPHIRQFYELAKKKDVAGIKKLSGEYKDEKGARANMFRYRDLLLVALKA